MALAFLSPEPYIQSHPVLKWIKKAIIMCKITIIEEYFKVKSTEYTVLNQPGEIMSCLKLLADSGLVALIIDNQKQINSYILNSTNRYYYAGLDVEGQMSTQGLLYENPAKGMNITAINDRYVVIFSDIVSFNDFLNAWSTAAETT